jgi:hypothetical protein
LPNDYSNDILTYKCRNVIMYPTNRKREDNIMAQQNRISRNNTRIERLGDYRVVTLHSTAIVKVHDSGMVTLNTGGWRTNTTKTRINQVANEWDLGFSVYQHDYTWYISIGGQSRQFTDGDTFDPNEPAWLISGLRFAW